MPKTFKDIVVDTLPEISELFPWDVEELIESNSQLMLVDIREKKDFDALHLVGSIHASRGVLEPSCSWGYPETIPELVVARELAIVVICRSGNRSALAAKTMQIMGYKNVTSMKTGIKGWNDSDYPLQDSESALVDPDWAEKYLSPPVTKEQLPPK